MTSMLPFRRDGITVPVNFGRQTETEDAEPKLSFRVRFNRDPRTGSWCECFYANDGKIKEGAEWQALIVDSCIGISKRLEHGETFAAIADSYGEDRAPGAASGPPSSIAGAIARAGAALEQEKEQADAR